ncbi:intraflagellar transport protein 25 homolog isoform X5 [Ictidomys tridecemlineatus]|uniref:intraflagellar transport protein 25 homolog isoform X3 n=1 Tax=Ictidomys tridecemlineatus TaxID=43179 RepID=UPI001A9F44C4|nr:intraflagellar transport protein 25 homolog isoform X3 [Ictidomys tridecemlineatus]
MRQFDLCLSSEGSEVVLATSSDEKHPPENIIDGNPETFWTTTGMFPQEFIICFHKHVKVEKLIIQSYLDFVHTEGQLQNEEILVHDGYCTYLRFIITKAFDHFISVHCVSAEGLVVSNHS